jgi:hypothetical protein
MSPASQVKSFLGWAPYVAKSRIPNAGLGVFVDGDVRLISSSLNMKVPAGTVVSMYPGIIVSRPPNTLDDLSSSVLLSLPASLYLLKRNDGILINAYYKFVVDSKHSPSQRAFKSLISFVRPS